MASPSTTSTPAGSTTERRTGTRWRSVSSATTVAPVSARARVSDPRPAPISSTREPAADAGEAGDAADRVGVGDEVLAEGPAGPQAVRRQQLGDVGAGMGHQEIVTSTTPWPRSAIWEKPSGDMSTTRG